MRAKLGAANIDVMQQFYLPIKAINTPYSHHAIIAQQFCWGSANKGIIGSLLLLQ